MNLQLTHGYVLAYVLLREAFLSGAIHSGMSWHRASSMCPSTDASPPGSSSDRRCAMSTARNPAVPDAVRPATSATVCVALRQGEKKDLLFVSTERYKFCVLEYDDSGDIRTAGRHILFLPRVTLL